MSDMTERITDPAERDAELAWELYEAQPTHPEIPRLAMRVLLAQPGRSGMRILLARWHDARGEVDEARKVLHDLVGLHDQQFVNAVRELRDLEAHERNYDQALHWARLVLRREPDGWFDHMRLAVLVAMADDLETGWDMMDEAVAMCARTAADAMPGALTYRALHLLITFAPVPRFLEAARPAFEADPGSEFLAHAMAYAYMHEYRFDDAEAHLLGMLRIDPTDEVAPPLLNMIRTIMDSLDEHEVSVDLLREQGLMEFSWKSLRANESGTSLAHALAALDDVMPAELRAVLRPPAPAEIAAESGGDRDIALWRDGQQPGTGALWGADEPFRLLSVAEIAEMDAAIEADPAAFPHWDAEESYFSQLLTDDAGAYLIEGPHGCLYRRGPEGDVELAPSASDWFWDRVVAFGGADPRPVALRGQGAAGA
ncbi:tetratricopeptide repeat protein [Propionibacteriaceae bacterium G57]|uniref:tetratricopeptide repeat protein n=1 Tax=Aestuariimicrobium sp. G57 TaxID=3418485 RepID=UPI003DA6D325